MNRYIAFVLAFLLLSLPAGSAYSQEKATVKVASVREKGATVFFTLNASKPFVFGNNRYYLYIGKREYTRNEQTKKNGKGVMTFFIPAREFSALRDGDAMYLAYGACNVEDEDMQAAARNSRHVWYLNTFSKGLLKK
jgi:hypothetical protein